MTVVGGAQMKTFLHKPENLVLLERIPLQKRWKDPAC